MITKFNDIYRHILSYDTISKIKKRTYIAQNRIDNLRFLLWEKGLKEKPIINNPIFIIGCPRSGTSIFVKLFATHPIVANWSEAGLIWDPVNYYNKEAEHCWEANIVKDETAKRLHAKFEWYRQIKKKERFVNKHPRNSVRLKYINKIFPDAYYIHVVRDGRAVVNSIIKKIMRESSRKEIPFGNFCKPPNWRKYLDDDIIKQTALQWREIVQYIINNTEKFGDRYYEIKYEDLCLNTQEKFASIFKFADLDVSGEILDNIPKYLNDMNFKYKEEFSQDQINVINRIQKDLLQKFGYII